MPPEARLGGGGSSAESALAWNEFAAADAADWDNFDDEGAAPHELLKTELTGTMPA